MGVATEEEQRRSPPKIFALMEQSCVFPVTVVTGTYTCNKIAWSHKKTHK